MFQTFIRRLRTRFRGWVPHRPAWWKRCVGWICRALGTLKNAKLIRMEEALDGLSAVRVGVEQKFLTGVDLPKLNNLLILIQPAHLAKIAARELGPEEEAQ